MGGDAHLDQCFQGFGALPGIAGEKHYSIYTRKWNSENGIIDECPLENGIMPPENGIVEGENGIVPPENGIVKME